MKKKLAGKTKPQPAPNNYSAIDLEDYEIFKNHPMLDPIKHKYEHDGLRAKYAISRLINDLEDINETYYNKYKRVAFTTIEGRVKAEESFLRKLHKSCFKNASIYGLTEASLKRFYNEIADVCGVRFSCPYFDEVDFAINKLVRPRLNALGYATNLQANQHFKDRNYLDKGDEFGYRSYHFFVKIPTNIDIYGHTELCLCEIQARTELQHIWAVKSHDLLYKPKQGWDFSDKHVADDMRELSNNLRFADQMLVSIRDRTKGKI